VRQAFLEAAPNLDKKTVGLRLQAKGFAEGMTHYQDGLKPTSKRTYEYAFGGVDGTCFVRLEDAKKQEHPQQ
jgi:hypothetical protein